MLRLKYHLRAISIALILQFLIRVGQDIQVRALPISTSTISPRLIVSSCDGQSNCRTSWDIVCSCALVIFSCTWVALHPNIPSPDDTSWDITFRRAMLMLALIIAPELAVALSLRQWIAARTLAKKFKESDWTKVHGFFGIMGGYSLYEGSRPVRVLWPGELAQFNLPPIDENRIEDRSKGDLVSKGLALIQTIWFILQCIARGVRHLQVTHLELVTVAFAIMTFATYLFWMDKPLHVRYGEAVPMSSKKEGMESAASGEDGTIWYNTMGKSLRDDSNSKARQVEKIPLIRILGEILRDDERSNFANQQRLPSFYGGGLTDAEYLSFYVSTVVIATIFGAIHCAGWQFDFPTLTTEQKVWQAASLAVTCIPAILMVFTLLHRYLWSWLSNVTTVILVGLYIIGRILLLGEAFVSLRSLTPSAYQTVVWSQFVPHIFN